MGVGISGPPYVKLHNAELTEVLRHIKKLLSLDVQIVEHSMDFNTDNHPLYAKLSGCKNWSDFVKGTQSFSLTAGEDKIIFTKKKKDRGGYSSDYKIQQSGEIDDLDSMNQIVAEIKQFVVSKS